MGPVSKCSSLDGKRREIREGVGRKNDGGQREEGCVSRPRDVRGPRSTSLMGRRTKEDSGKRVEVRKVDS